MVKLEKQHQTPEVQKWKEVMSYLTTSSLAWFVNINPHCPFSFWKEEENYCQASCICTITKYKIVTEMNKPVREQDCNVIFLQMNIEWENVKLYSGILEVLKSWGPKGENEPFLACEGGHFLAIKRGQKWLARQALYMFLKKGKLGSLSGSLP